MQKEKNYKCCICGKLNKGWGNNPWGVVDKDGNLQEWKDEDRCCDECNLQFVVSGRLYMMQKDKLNKI